LISSGHEDSTSTYSTWPNGSSNTYNYYRSLNGSISMTYGDFCVNLHEHMPKIAYNKGWQVNGMVSPGNVYGAKGVTAINVAKPNFGNFAVIDTDAILNPPQPITVTLAKPVESGGWWDWTKGTWNTVCTEVSTIFTVGWEFQKGIWQGGLNLLNGIQDVAIGTANLALFSGYNVASYFVNLCGGDNPYAWIPSPDWSCELLVGEGGTPGGWDDMHGWSKWCGATGVLVLWAAYDLAGTALGEATSMGELLGTVKEGVKNVFKRPSKAPKYSPKVVDIGDDVIDWLGEGYRVTTNSNGDKIFISKNGDKMFRTDFYNNRGEGPHIHFQELINGIWCDVFPNLPHKIPGIRSRRLRSQRRDRIILADNCSEVKKAEQAHAEN